jgi:hypothetical protein
VNAAPVPPRPVASPGAELTVVGLGVVAVGLTFVAPVVAAFATLVGLGIIVLGTPATEEVSLGLPVGSAAGD